MGNRLSYPEVDLSGKVAVVTGGNTGIGYETAKALAAMGAHTIIACRSREKAREAIERIQTEVSTEREGRQSQVEFMPLDLASLQSAREFTVAFQDKNLPLHILINNAGVAWVPLSKTDDGYEVQLQVNHLGHFLLTLELLPVLQTTARESGDVRVVCVSSLTHSWYNWEPNNMNAETDYSRLKFYPKSKLYNIMAAHVFQRRLQNEGITFSTLHPGTVNTGIVQGASDLRLLNFLFGGVKWALRTPKDGAATTLNCAVNPDLNSQQCLYYNNCIPATSSPDSRNESYQEELWKRSIDMVREYLSPEILSTYGPPQPSPAIPAQDGDSDTVPPSPPTPAQDGDSDTVPPSPPTPAQDGDSETAHTAVHTNEEDES